jgi:PilZ domain-containing protein
MNQTSPSPQRKHARYRCNQKLCVRYRIDGQDFIAYGRCTMVGKGGLGAHLPAELPLGQVATLEISLTVGGIPQTVKGQVVNRRGPNYGFQFLEVTDRAVIGLRTLFQPQPAVAR